MEQLFDVQPLNFISKPIDSKKVIENLNLAMKRAKKLSGIFEYKKGKESHNISVGEILYFESINREMRMVTSNGEDVFYDTLGNVAEQVLKYQFVQIHRSYIVNYRYVTIVRSDEMLMTNGDVLPIGQSRRREIKNMFLNME